MEPTRAQLLREAQVAARATRYDDALAIIARALAAYPGDPPLLVTQADYLRASGQAEASRDVAQRAVRAAPTSAAAHAALGLALLDLQRLKPAEISLDKALSYDRSNAEALAGLCCVRLKQARFAEAEQLAVGAVRARPADAAVYLLLGDVFAARGNQAGTLEAYRRARGLDLLNPEAAEKYIAAQQAAGGLAGARAALEDAASRMPDVAQVHLQLGRFLLENGLLDEAAQSLRRALSLDPSSSAIQFLAEAKTFTPDDPDLKLIEASYAASPADTPRRATAAFALAKAADDVSDYGRAFEAYREGNAIVRRGMEFSLAREQRAFEAIAAAFSAELIAKLRDKGHPSAAPIFIVGMPRSGTTLTETILSRNPGVFPAGELEFLRVEASRVVGSSPISEARPFADRLRAPHLTEIGNRYLGDLPARARDATRFTDKLPHNFRILGLIRLVFPNAKIVHVRRDPLDNCLSMFKSRFAMDALAFTFDLVELGRYYNLYRGLMAHWRRVIPDGFFEIDYESLVGDPETSTRALFDYCGLDWSPDVLDIGNNRREVLTMSAAQVRQPINTRSVSAAARYGSHLDPLRAALAEWDDHQP